MRRILITPPSSEPLSLIEVKAYLKQDSADDDVTITGMIKRSREWCETFTRRAMLLQTWELVLDGFPTCTRLNPRAGIQLPLGRTKAIAWLKYTDTDGVEQTLTGPSSSPAGTGYQEDLLDDYGGLLVPAYGTSWPSVKDVLNPVRVRFQAGYDDADSVPGQLRDAMLYHLASLYENRGEQDTKAWQGIDEGMASPFVIRWFGE